MPRDVHGDGSRRGHYLIFESSATPIPPGIDGGEEARLMLAFRCRRCSYDGANAMWLVLVLVLVMPMPRNGQPPGSDGCEENPSPCLRHQRLKHSLKHPATQQPTTPYSPSTYLA